MSIEKLKQVSEELNAAKAKVQEFAKNEGRAAIGAAFQDAFAKHPDARSFGWCQYTPYFNDGDECVFSVRDPYLIPLSADEDASHYDFALWGKYPECFSAECRADFLAVWKVCNDREVLKSVFGDHVEITITRDEVTVEDYSHD
jgi:hypothetical protein